MRFRPEEIAEVTEMLHYLNLDVRAVTLSLDVTGKEKEEIVETVESKGSELVRAVREVSEEHGIPIVTVRMALTPLAEVVNKEEELVELAKELDRAAVKTGVDALGGFGAFAEVGLNARAKTLIKVLPEVLSKTERLFGFLNVGDTWSGLNVEAVYEVSEALIDLAIRTKGTGNAKFLVSANLPGDVPFMPGAHHGKGRPEAEVNVAISGPGVMEAVVRRSKVNSFRELYEVLKKAAFKIARLGEFAGRKVAEKMGVEMGSVDLSLAPTPKMGDSVAKVVEAMGVPSFGAPGTLAALALLVEALKKGGAMAVSRFGGFSGLFVPLSEDSGMVEAAQRGTLDLYKLIAYTSVCSAGLDMVPIPLVTPETLASITLGQLMIGVINSKPLGVRLLPVPDAKPGDVIELGGLLGRGVVLPVEDLRPNNFIRLKGHVPPPTLRLHRG